MDNVTALDKLVRSLSFEVQAVPQDNIIQVTTTSKSAPLNVKIRVRKKEEAGLHHGVITLPPSTSHPHSSPEIIRLVSSDQTIMSFNMIMEADFGKPKKKTRKNILGIFKPACFGSQSDEDVHEGEINEGSTTQSDGALKRTTLKKNKDERTRDFFGKCKPGGCLDPPFGEDRVPYSPANEEEPACDDKGVNASIQSEENKQRSSSIFSNKIKGWKRKKSNEETMDKNDGMKREKDAKTESILDLYQSGSIRTSTTFSNSVMTYPHTVNSSELRIQENKLRPSDVCIDPSKNSFNEHSGPFFVPGTVPGTPKKINIEEEDAERNTGQDANNMEDNQRPQDIGISNEKQPRSKDSAVDNRELSTDPRTDICRKTDSSSAPKTDMPNLIIIPVVNPLQKIGTIEPPFTSTIKAEGETKETEVLVTSSDNHLDPGYERLDSFADQKNDESNIESLLPLDPHQNTNNNTLAKNIPNKNQLSEDVESEKCTKRQINDDGIEHILAPHKFDISQKNVPEMAQKNLDNDLNFTDSSPTVKSPKEADMTQNLDTLVQTDIERPEDQSNKLTTQKDFTEQISPEYKSESCIDNNTEDKKAVNPDIKQELEELLVVENDTSKTDDITMPTPTNELEDADKPHKANESKKLDEKSIDTFGSDRQLSAYSLSDPDQYVTTGNDDPGVPTPIKRDTPLELVEDDLHQIWKNDSLESAALHTSKNTHEENIGILDKVKEANDESSNIFISNNNAKDTEALNSATPDNDDENINISGKENKENIEQYDTNGIESASSPREETDILEITHSDEGDINIMPETIDNLLEDPLEINNGAQTKPYAVKKFIGNDTIGVSDHEKGSDDGIQKYDEEQQKSGDRTPTDQVRDIIKSDEKHITFIDVVNTEKNQEETVVSPKESVNSDNSKRILENDTDIVLDSKESYPDSDLSSTGRDFKTDIASTVESGKSHGALSGVETKYPYRSISGAQSPATDFPKSFKIDLGIQSYIDNDNVIVKSFDSDTAPQRYPNDTVKFVKCDLEIGNEILIPIGSENDLVVEIKSNKPKAQNIREVGRLDTGMTEKACLGTEFQISPVTRKLVIADDIRKTLLTVYEEELLPLRKSISELKRNMEVFASQQVVPRGHNMFERRTRPSKIVPPLFKNCGCIRR